MNAAVLTFAFVVDDVPKSGAAYPGDISLTSIPLQMNQVAIALTGRAPLDYRNTDTPPPLPPQAQRHRPPSRWGAGAKITVDAWRRNAVESEILLPPRSAWFSGCVACA